MSWWYGEHHRPYFFGTKKRDQRMLEHRSACEWDERLWPASPEPLPGACGENQGSGRTPGRGTGRHRRSGRSSSRDRGLEPLFKQVVQILLGALFIFVEGVHELRGEDLFGPGVHLLFTG